MSREAFSSRKRGPLRSATARAALSFALAAAPAFAPSSGAAFAGQGNVCHKTAKLLLKSCKEEANGSYSAAMAKCANISDPTGRASCESAAAAALRDDLDACAEQRDARLSACDRLGPSAYDPPIDPANFTTTIDNPYFPLRPGTTFVYEGHTASGLEHDEFAATRNTRVIDGVVCVEVHDSVFLDGVLAEDTLDWFAQDRQGNVWYFGENTHELEDGLITTTEGSFRVGIDGDKPGIIMETHPAVGDFYRQEFSPGNAEDYAEVAGLDETVSVPAGAYAHCLKSRETTPLEPDLLEDKYYAPGVGNVLEIDERTGDRIELIRIVEG